MKILPEKLREANFRSYMLGKGCVSDITTFRGIQIFVVRSLSLAVGWRRHIGSRSEANLPINRGFDHHLGFLGCVIPSTLSIQINRCSKLCQDKLQTVSTRET